MSILKSFGAVKTSFPSVSWPYIDTPDFSYDQWLTYLSQQQPNPLPIGQVANSPTVAIIGAGVSGACAAYELSKAGCAVTVFDAASEVGGRCASDAFPEGGPDIAEMGSMRFPPSEFILDFYLKELGLVTGGLSSLPEFPDPGKKGVPTYLSYEGSQELWPGGPNTLPGSFAVVSNGWGTFYDDGITITSLANPTPYTETVYYSPGQMATLLASNTSDNFNDATAMWAKYIRRFGQMTFYEGMYELFSGKGRGEPFPTPSGPLTQYDIPGGQAWGFSEFDKFGALGVGSGGFGPLYPIGFTEIMRLLINGLENSQKFLQQGIRSVPVAMMKAAGNLNATLVPGVTINLITRTGTAPSFSFTLKSSQNGKTYGPFDRVIVATTTRAMELTTNVTAYVQPNTPALLSPDVCQAIMRTHVVSSNKVAIRIGKFWNDNPNAVRCLQTDTLVRQVYTLDYGASDGTAVGFLSYVWDDDAVKQQSLTEGIPRSDGTGATWKLYNALYDSLQAMGGEVATWAQNLQPYSGQSTDVLFEEWQSDACFGGAFKLSQPGQDTYVQRMFFDYQKFLQGGVNPDTGVYIAGDCIAWNSGWVEGGLQTALNAAAGVITSLGGMLNAYPNPIPGSAQTQLTPLTIDPNRYQYT